MLDLVLKRNIARYFYQKQLKDNANETLGKQRSLLELQQPIKGAGVCMRCTIKARRNKNNNKFDTRIKSCNKAIIFVFPVGGTSINSVIDGINIRTMIVTLIT